MPLHPYSRHILPRPRILNPSVTPTSRENTVPNHSRGTVARFGLAIFLGIALAVSLTGFGASAQPELPSVEALHLQELILNSHKYAPLRSLSRLPGTRLYLDPYQGMYLRQPPQWTAFSLTAVCFVVLGLAILFSFVWQIFVRSAAFAQPVDPSTAKFAQGHCRTQAMPCECTERNGPEEGSEQAAEKPTEAVPDLNPVQDAPPLTAGRIRRGDLFSHTITNCVIPKPEARTSLVRRTTPAVRMRGISPQVLQSRNRSRGSRL
jgi:hypothetical protein|eukprot:CAMPEP_0174298902 /NCGR_PEP_ID=MMETSP0809-20121228/55136_1 /TAXON_ID=73025 ORGANISM="Eutreptiella gymnastica-like, Strain CCMP1594" /NCGR_SAMPLE_ID=MMETSP0809 /ASSEMBLY_ACC=CAM_ASM_000658 /LENGTH=262 /DNA_ID=CAMNT_0015403695 /DNA_START=22 /DNA_END=810 /DNA_ORIENTATION=+